MILSLAEGVLINPVVSSPGINSKFILINKGIRKLSMDLLYATTAKWVEAVMGDFDSFLQDHANCERKTSAMAMSFVAKCPDKVEIIPTLIETALEELEHFKLVYDIMNRPGVMLKKEMPRDQYIHSLIESCRSGRGT